MAKKPKKDLTFEVLRAALFEKCRQLGVKSVTVEYSGGGDDGSVNDVNFEGIDPNGDAAKGVTVAWPTEGRQEWNEKKKRFEFVPGDGVEELSLEKAFQSYCYDVLERHCPGDWINNEGGYGNLHINTLEPPYDVKLEYHQNTNSTIDYEIDADTGEILKESS